jgi:diadenosine tetraphosphate (Ap4A) HIT family hydrolase
VSECETCESIRAPSAPGGCIYETRHWFIDHCIGPLGVGTLIVKPKRHVVHVAELASDEAAELGSLLQRATAVVTDLEQPEQVYLTLWAHLNAVPGHIHFVIQPVTRTRMDEHDGKDGLRLQVEMFDRKDYPDPTAAAAFADRARAAWASLTSPEVSARG